MDGSTNPQAEPIGEARQCPRLLIRAGRGRTGGSTGLDLAVQRGKASGAAGQAAGRRPAEPNPERALPGAG